MTKKTQTATKDAVAVAILNQIGGYSNRPLTWRVETAKAILKVKDKAVKATTTAKTDKQLKAEIIDALIKFVSKQGVRKLQAIIKGEISLNDVVKGITTSVTTTPDPIKATEAEYQSLLDRMTEGQLFAMLKALTTYTPVKAKAAKATTPSKGGYTSLDDQTAYAIAAEYLTKVAEGGRVCAPEGFLGKRTANPTTAVRRFIFSTICRDLCDILNSVPAAVAEYYTANAPEITSDPENTVKMILDDHKEIYETIKGWQDEPYIKSVLKK